MHDTAPTVLSNVTVATITSYFNVYGSVHRKYISLYIQQDATLHNLFTSENCSTCFKWYHPKHVEQFPDINKMCKVASCWIYSETTGHVIKLFTITSNEYTITLSLPICYNIRPVFVALSYK
jgi:hypothetical protein